MLQHRQDFARKALGAFPPPRALRCRGARGRVLSLAWRQHTGQRRPSLLFAGLHFPAPHISEWPPWFPGLQSPPQRSLHVTSLLRGPSAGRDVWGWQRWCLCCGTANCVNCLLRCLLLGFPCCAVGRGSARLGPVPGAGLPGEVRPAEAVQWAAVHSE